jgi:hypothetical protein
MGMKKVLKRPIILKWFITSDSWSAKFTRQMVSNSNAELLQSICAAARVMK